MICKNAVDVAVVAFFVVMTGCLAAWVASGRTSVCKCRAEYPCVVQVKSGG